MNNLNSTRSFSIASDATTAVPSTKREVMSNIHLANELIIAAAAEAYSASSPIRCESF